MSGIKDIVSVAKNKGMDAIAITDHSSIEGWEEAKKVSQELNFPIILGDEIYSKQGDIIGLFLKEKIQGKKKEARFVMEEIKKQGGVVIIPHAFHGQLSFKEDLTNYLDLIDGIEVINGRRPSNGPDRKALEFAKKHNLAMTGGTDAHCAQAVGDAYTQCEANSLEEFKQAILNKKTMGSGKKSNLIYILAPTLAKLGLKKHN